MMRFAFFCLVTSVLLSGLVTVCNASLVTVTFEWPLDIVDPPLTSRFSPDDLMQVSITYESSEPDTNSDPYVGAYDCIQSFSVFVDSSIDYTATATDGLWTIRNDWPPPLYPPPYSDQASVNIIAHLQHDLFAAVGLCVAVMVYVSINPGQDPGIVIGFTANHYAINECQFLLHLFQCLYTAIDHYVQFRFFTFKTMHIVILERRDFAVLFGA